MIFRALASYGARTRCYTLGILVASTLLFTGGTARAQAVIPTAGDTPYQQTVSIMPSQVSCGNYGVCTVAFPAVPQHKRLVVLYTSLRFTAYSDILDATLTNGLTGTGANSIQMPGATVINVGQFNTSRYSGQVLFFVSQGQTPTMSFYGLGINGDPLAATLVGVLVPE